MSAVRIHGQRLRRRRVARCGCSRGIAARPCLEILEGRTLLSTAIPINSLTWTDLGPAPVTVGQTPHLDPVSGRIVAAAADPVDANTLYVAAADGGVWKTTDGGTKWKALTDDQSTLFMGAITVSRSNPRVIYAGTGEADDLTVLQSYMLGGNTQENSLSAFYGRGVLKSTDGGTTWTLLPGNAGKNEFDRRTISQIVIDPANSNVVYVSMGDLGTNGLLGNTGVWKTTDGGATWANTTLLSNPSIPATVEFSDLVMDPADSKTLYAAVGEPFGNARNGVYKTTNAGATWVLLDGKTAVNGAQDGRIKLAIGRDTNSVPARTILYESIPDPRAATFGNLYRFLRSVDGGLTWTNQTANVTAVYDPLGSQGYFDNAIGVDPSDTKANTVFFGGAFQRVGTNDGSFLLRTTDGGASWRDASGTAGGTSGPHADHHAIIFDAKNRAIDVNDGGIWRLADVKLPVPDDGKSPLNVTWTDLNTNLETVTFYGVALDPSNADIAYGGSQDTGTEKFNNARSWQTAGTTDAKTGQFLQQGDGGLVRVDPANPMIVYHAFNGVSLYRSNDGGTTWTQKSPATGADPANFVVPYILDPSDSKRVLLGTDRVWVSANRGDTWATLSPAAFHFPAVIDSLAEGRDGKTFFAGIAGGRVFVTTDNGVTWTERDPAAANAAVRYRSIVVDPTNASIAYVVPANFGDVTGGRHVFRTTNAGVAWTDITGNFPDLPAWSLALDAPGPGFADDTLYVGTDAGIFSANGNGVSWTKFGAGLPNVQVQSLDLQSVGPTPGPKQKILAAGTHGRGLWEIVLNSLSPPAIACYDGLNSTDNPTSEPPDTQVAAGPTRLIETVNSVIGVFDASTGVKLSTQSLADFFKPLTTNSLIDPVVTFDESIANGAGNLPGRFIVVASDVDAVNQKTYLDIAVSDDAYDTSSFKEKQRIDISESTLLGSNLWGSFTRMGFNADAVVLTVNMNFFPFAEGGGGGFDHVQMVAITASTLADRDKTTIAFNRFDVSNTIPLFGLGNFSLVPAIMHDTTSGGAMGGPMWFVEEGAFFPLFWTSIRLIKVDQILAPALTVSVKTDVTVPGYRNLLPKNQPGGTVDAGADTRITNAVLRGNRLVACQTVGTGSILSRGPDHARWYEFDVGPATPTLKQAGDIDLGATVDTYYPSVELAADGDIGMTFMASSSTMAISMYVTGQVPGDAVGTMRPPTLIRAGANRYTGMRLGDYSGIALDPVNCNAFWAANEFTSNPPAGGAAWGTKIAQFTLHTATPQSIIDNRNWGYRDVGSGWVTRSGGYLGSYRYNTPGFGTNVARWNFPVTAGTYEVYVTWVSLTGNSQTAPFKVFNGNTQLAAISVDQSVAPRGVIAQGFAWKCLGIYKFAQASVLRVDLSDVLNGFVVADAAFIAKLTGGGGGGGFRAGVGSFAATNQRTGASGGTSAFGMGVSAADSPAIAAATLTAYPVAAVDAVIAPPEPVHRVRQSAKRKLDERP